VRVFQLNEIIDVKSGHRVVTAIEVLGPTNKRQGEGCKEHLNDEYAALSRKLAEKLARKRPSPILSGGPNAWASRRNK
jgi:Domain of unknown function (DUF6398)/Protein of unknown function (DUF4058)